MLLNRNRILLDHADRIVPLSELEARGLVTPVDRSEIFRVPPLECAMVSDSDAGRCEVSADDDGAPMRWVPLREAWNLIDPGLWTIAAKCSELLQWNARTRYCPVCGAPMRRHTEISKRCTGCGDEIWPQLSPAILVLVTRGEEALLVHAANFRNKMHALVAGFVETGETLEECVRREVLEETALQIDDIRYLGSQSWPYPGQLMIGFTARYAGGTLRWADGELTSGGFFTRDNLPQLPTPPSLSRAIIDMWIRGDRELKYPLF